MSKTKTMHELINLLAISLRHKIGSIVNNNEIYAQKYAKDAEVLLNEAKKISLKEHWNLYDKKKIREELSLTLRKELESKTFIGEKKFDLMDEEMSRVLKELGIGE